MTCDVVQNRLLALPDSDAVPADLRAHLDGCDLCRRYLDRFLLLDTELADLPAPASEVRAAFLESLTAAGPVIKSIPSVPYRAGWSWPAAKRVGWKPAAGLAAAAVVGVGLWANRGGAPKPIEADVAAGPRHELLQQVVALDNRLARAATPRERIPLLTEMAVALKNETGGVYKAARSTDDVRSLAGMFEAVVRDGIVKQAGRFDRLDPVAERHQVLTAAADALADAGRAVAELARSAPPQVKDDLTRMAAAADDGRAKLLKIREGT
jgi:hypothetical protein